VSVLFLPTLRWVPERACWKPYRALQPCEWPVEVDLSRLPRPAYGVGVRIYFHHSGPRPWEGLIQLIEIPGGSYQPWEEVSALLEARYYRPEVIVYLVQARGHMRLVRASRVIGISTGTDLRPLLEHGYEDL
jgi:hypothetical protein